MNRRSQTFLSHNPTELARIGAFKLFEHPTRGDTAPIYMITPSGQLINTGFYDLGDFDLALCLELEESATPYSNIWFALGHDGQMYCLCDCGDFDAAEESARDLGVNAIWIADQERAEQWFARLYDNLPKNKTRIKLSGMIGGFQ
jgi:hypothetical protein